MALLINESERKPQIALQYYDAAKTVTFVNGKIFDERMTKQGSDRHSSVVFTG
jgi:hypothetical protein